MTNEELLRSISLEGEEWRDVVGYEGIYTVSSFGRIISNRRTANIKHGVRIVQPKLLSPVIKKTGYCQIILSKEGNHKFALIHQLVAQAFIENPENKPMVDHIDRNKQNNHVSNLRWCTLSENMNNPLTVQHCKQMNTGLEFPEHRKPVVSLKEGVLIKKYNSIKDTVEDGFVPNQVSSVCAGRWQTHKGFQWMYLSDYESLINKSKNSLPAPITAD